MRCENPYHLFFTNLANPLKIEIMMSLRAKEKNVTELSNALKMEQSKISHALASLRCCNIVGVKQKGKERIYSLDKTTIPLWDLIAKNRKNVCENCLKSKEK
ncbi:MAG: metalloregulator ArsR/SmtB family transcription factor [Nanoarchaeota archaeon]|nr:metalloregulator ArsR/SmtB family transcription factor [Nanoarchaeota archaeon]